MSDQNTKHPSDTPTTSPAAVKESADSPLAERDRKIWFEQYKLAVEMAAQISSKRQDANKFYIGLVSTFGVLYKAFDKLPPLPNVGLLVNAEILPLLGVCWCLVWWFTIRSYRRINMAKWKVIYELESKLPCTPFYFEKVQLRELAKGNKTDKESKAEDDEGRGSFALTKLELIIPLIVGVAFLFLATLPLLDHDR